MSLHYYDTLRTYRRRELGIDFVCHVKRGGYTELVTTGGYSDMPSIFDHTAFGDGMRERELRNALRRHARWVAKR